MREQNLPEMVFRQFVSVKEGGSKVGDTVYFNKRLRIDTKGGTLAETATVPNNLIKFMKGSVVVAEWGNGELRRRLVRFLVACMIFRTVCRG